MMSDNVYGFFMGAVIAGLICFALGYNHGRGAPLLSNPFEKAPSWGEKMKQHTEDALDRAKKKIHDATAP